MSSFLENFQKLARKKRGYYPKIDDSEVRRRKGIIISVLSYKHDETVISLRRETKLGEYYIRKILEEMVEEGSVHKTIIPFKTGVSKKAFLYRLAYI